MTVPAETVFTIAETIRDAVIDAYADESISLPDRRAVSDSGEIAWDCEELKVSLGRVYRGVANAPSPITVPQRCASIRTAEFHVWIIRCASTPQDDGSPPTVARMESLALPIYTDAWFLPFSLTQAALDGSLGLSCDDVLVGDLTVRGPEGAYVAVDLIVAATLGSGTAS